MSFRNFVIRFFVGLYFWIAYILKRFLVIGEIIIFLRVVLKFAGANEQSFVVANIYKYTDMVIWPFDPIFPNIYWQGHLIDIVALSAMLGYAIAFLILLSILTLIVKS